MKVRLILEYGYSVERAMKSPFIHTITEMAFSIGTNFDRDLEGYSTTKFNVME